MPRSRTSKPLARCLVALAALAGTPAEAATLATDRQCYREGEPVGLSGGPFSPNGAVDVSLDGARLGSPFQANAGGALAGRLTAPGPGGASERSFTIAASDRANPALRASAVRLVSRFGVTVQPLRGSPGRRRRITACGFTTGGILYAHVVRGRLRRTVTIGRLAGACGTLTTTKRVLRPRARRGNYRVQFDTRRAYSRATVPRAIYRVLVGRTFRLPGGRQRSTAG